MPRKGARGGASVERRCPKNGEKKGGGHPTRNLEARGDSKTSRQTKRAKAAAAGRKGVPKNATRGARRIFFQGGDPCPAGFGTGNFIKKGKSPGRGGPRQGRVPEPGGGGACFRGRPALIQFGRRGRAQPSNFTRFRRRYGKKPDRPWGQASFGADCGPAILKRRKRWIWREKGTNRQEKVGPSGLAESQRSNLQGGLAQGRKTFGPTGRQGGAGRRKANLRKSGAGCRAGKARCKRRCFL